MSDKNLKEVMGLQEYINKYFGGNQSNFAKSCGKSDKHIWRQLQSSSYIVVDGEVAQVKYNANTCFSENNRK